MTNYGILFSLDCLAAGGGLRRHTDPASGDNDRFLLLGTVVVARTAWSGGRRGCF